MKLNLLILSFLFILSFTTATYPKDFIWGTATASYQVEGASNVDGKQPSIWDIFSHITGKTNNGDTGDLADDEYHRFEEDIEIMKNLGVSHYRFSIAWSRIMTYSNNATQVNQQGLAYYNKLIDSLQAAGIQGLATLYHWDIPQYLDENMGGWLNRDIVSYFEEYADVCFQAFGDRVKYWLTFNEPRSFTILGYGNGMHAPGRCSDRSICAEGDSTTEPYITSHNVLRSHAAVVHLYRQKY